jgi:cysteinyl-tRNA synthetase
MDQLDYDVRHTSVEVLDDDFNIAPALAALFHFIHKINIIMDKNGLSPSDKEKVMNNLERINSVLAVMDLEPPKPDKDVETLIKKRELARKNKDWDKADELRQKLKEMGIEVFDTEEGTVWRS